ncbi:mucin-like protein [Achlya hypogyna]|uniref:Mucin-like protein n=1 Tax=Achlya hypogyna TaxID=1202772 RepID=A0A1V9YAT5_ACHHY|nr:mucin-like protein [Achlya hypogyna]
MAPSEVLLNKVTVPPTTIPVVVTVDPNDLGKLDKLNDLGTTAPPAGASGSSSKAVANDHSENRNRGQAGSQAALVETKKDVTTGTESSALQTVRYITSALVGITLVVLAFFQFLAMNPSYLLPDSAADRLLAPNSWELPLFVSFVQQVGALALARNAKVPQLFYTNFLDSLSWLNFLIRGSAPAPSTASVSSFQLHRRLADVDAVGFAQFALRTDVKERDWFLRVWVAFLVLLAVILVCVIATAVFAKWAATRGNPFHTETSDSHKRSVNLRSISRRLLGMCVVVAYLVLLPMTMIALFEILQDSSTAGFPHANAILALVSLVLVIGALGAGMVALYRKTEAGLSRWQTRVVFGAVYSNYTYCCRLFFAAPALVQVLTGVVVATVTANPLTQLLVLIVLHLVYVAAMVLLRPFECSVHFAFALATEGLIMVLYGLAAGMTGDNLTKDTQVSLSYAIIVLVLIVFVLMFIRQLVMLWTYSSGWAKESNESYTGLPTLHDHDMESGAGQYTISLHGSEPRSGTHLSDPKEADSPTNTIRIVDTSKQIQI